MESDKVESDVLASLKQIPNNYNETAMKLLKECDEKYLLRWDCFSKSSVSFEKRIELIQKIFDLCIKCESSEDTLFQSIHLLDFLLTNSSNESNCLDADVLAVTCFFVTSKMTESSDVDPSSIESNVTNLQQIFSHELEILKKTDFSVFFATPFKYLFNMLPQIHQSHEFDCDKISSLVFFITACSLLDINLRKLSVETLTSVALNIVLEIEGIDFQVDIKDISVNKNCILEMLKQLPKDSFVFTRYKNKEGIIKSFLSKV